MNEEKARLEYRPHFATWLELWDLFESVVEGMPAILQYLYRYPAESQKKYEYRRNLATWHGIPSEILLRWVQTFSKALVTETVPEPLKPLLEDIDGAGQPISKWRKHVFDEMGTYGVVWGVVDAPATDVEIKTEAQRRELGVSPYVSLYSPTHVINWNEDSRGKLTMAMIDTGETKLDEEKKVFLRVIRKYEITGDSVTVTDIYADDQHTIRRTAPVTTLTMIGVDKKPLLPVFRAGIVKSKKYPGYYRSPLSGIAEKSRQLFNKESQAEVLYAKAAFSFLIWPEGKKVKSIGQNTLVEIAPGEILPAYVEPTATLFEQFRSESTKLIRDLFVVAGVKPTQTELVDNRKSGAAISEERHEQRDKVSIIADAVHTFEQNMWSAMCAFIGRPELLNQITLEYPLQYDINSMNDDIAELERYALLRNATLYMDKFTGFVRRKVLSKETQNKAIEEQAKSLTLRFSALPDAVIANAANVLKNGIVSLGELVRAVNPEYATKSDKEAEQIAIENIRRYKEVSDEYGIAQAVNSILGQET